MKFGVIQALLVSTLSVALSACGGSDEPPAFVDEPVGNGADSVYALLPSLKTDAMRDAFERLRSYDYTELLRTEQIGPERNVMALRERVIRHETQGRERIARVLSVDSAGRFHFGFLGRFASESGGVPAEEKNAFPNLNLEDPAYLSPRSRDAFRYVLGPEVLLDGNRVRVIEITAAGEERDEQAIQQAEIYFDPESRQIIAASVRQQNPTWLFQEETWTFAAVTRLDSGAWVPDSVSVLSRIDMPMGPARTFRTASSYREFSPATR